MMMMRKARRDDVRVWDFPCDNPRSSCLLPFFAFLCGHSWNPSEHTFVVIVLYTFTTFVQREVRWAIILRYIKRFEFYLIFFSKQVWDCMLNGQDVLLRLDVQGSAIVRKLLGQDAVFILMVLESEMALVK